MAYLVSQRAPEIAIRMALGAQRWMVFRLIVGQGMKLVLIGLALGLTLSFAVTRLLSTLLFGTSPTDLVTITGASFTLRHRGVRRLLPPIPPRHAPGRSCRLA
jgi:ABC-type antimicrobial peptide transport system permease subunit